eukprot:1951492-Pyramimonas_sp.AAC.1
MVSPDIGDVKLLLSTALVLTAEARDLRLILRPAKSAVVADGGCLGRCPKPETCATLATSCMALEC